MSTPMDIDEASPATAQDTSVEQQDTSKGKSKAKDTGERRRFEVKKWNAVALWAWGKHKKRTRFSLFASRAHKGMSCLQKILLSTTVPSVETISWTYALNVKQTKHLLQPRSVPSRGEPAM
ncbi:hypothetical protein EC973_004373 [Apophysomyces ossiformis]|uniref:Uncharacterized protein n=1 Tax=Apophysomyces ossiformis TaxID=679940 RepID=A0A8H7BK84_9FUNG|nr:hypothetical protein EC973_004373 [Apophysomyces ossiformis]